MESTEAGTGPVDDMDNLVLERGHIILEDEQHMGILKLTKIHWRAILICKSGFSQIFAMYRILIHPQVAQPSHLVCCLGMIQ